MEGLPGDCPCPPRVPCPLPFWRGIIEPICPASGAGWQSGSDTREGREGGTALLLAVGGSGSHSFREGTPPFHRAAQPVLLGRFPGSGQTSGCGFVKPVPQEPGISASPRPRLCRLPAAPLGAEGLIVAGRRAAVTVGGKIMWSERRSPRDRAGLPLAGRTRRCQQVLHSSRHAHHGPEQGRLSDEVQVHVNCSEI